MRKYNAKPRLEIQGTGVGGAEPTEYETMIINAYFQSRRNLKQRKRKTLNNMEVRSCTVETTADIFYNKLEVF